jgi:predicted PurR-regulated permease PerM
LTEFSARAFQHAATWVALAALAIGVVWVFMPFLVPLGWAAVFSVFLYPLFDRLGRVFPGRTLRALAIVVLVAVLLIVIVVSLMPSLIGQSASFLGSISTGDYIGRARTFLEHYWARSPVPLGDVQEVIDELVRRARAAVAGQSARVAGNFLGSIFDLAVVLLAMFYMLRDGERIVQILRDASPWSVERHQSMIGEAAELVQVTIFSTFVTAAVQGTLGGLVFWSLGMPSPVFWGALMTLMAFLPVVGPWLVWGPAAVGLLIADETSRGIALLLLGFLIVSGVDNVLRPALIAGRSQLNGLLVLISVLGGINAIGFLGVVLGPLLVATAAGLLKGYHESVAAERNRSNVRRDTPANGS